MAADRLEKSPHILSSLSDAEKSLSERLAPVRFDERSTVFDKRHGAIFYRCGAGAMIRHG
nr:hypothetical protein [uncultured Sphingomonas sp.]